MTAGEREGARPASHNNRPPSEPERVLKNRVLPVKLSAAGAAEEFGKPDEAGARHAMSIHMKHLIHTLKESE